MVLVMTADSLNGPAMTRSDAGRWFLALIAFVLVVVGVVVFSERKEAADLAFVFDRGAAAYRAGVSAEANPYRIGSFNGNARYARIWLDGWIDAKTRQQEEKP